MNDSTSARASGEISGAQWAKLELLKVDCGSDMESSVVIGPTRNNNRILSYISSLTFPLSPPYSPVPVPLPSSPFSLTLILFIMMPHLASDPPWPIRLGMHWQQPEHTCNHTPPLFLPHGIPPNWLHNDPHTPSANSPEDAAVAGGVLLDDGWIDSKLGIASGSASASASSSSGQRVELPCFPYGTSVEHLEQYQIEYRLTLSILTGEGVDRTAGRGTSGNKQRPA